MYRKLFVIAPVFALLVVASIVGVTLSTGGTAAQAGDDGILTAAEGAGIAGTLTITHPTCVNQGEHFQVSTSHPAVNPLVGVVLVKFPTTDPGLYALELEANARTYNGAAGGAIFDFYVPTWTQIGGRAIIKAKTTGFADVFGVFSIPC